MSLSHATLRNHVCKLKGLSESIDDHFNLATICSTGSKSFWTWFIVFSTLNFSTSVLISYDGFRFKDLIRGLWWTGDLSIQGIVFPLGRVDGFISFINHFCKCVHPWNISSVRVCLYVCPCMCVCVCVFGQRSSVCDDHVNYREGKLNQQGVSGSSGLSCFHWFVREDSADQQQRYTSHTSFQDVRCNKICHDY